MRRSQLLIYGFTMFSMFFGSGNLVFPLQIGFESGHFWIYGFWGLFLTGIVLPFLGLLVIKKYKGSYDLFFAEAMSSLWWLRTLDYRASGSQSERMPYWMQSLQTTRQLTCMAMRPTSSDFSLPWSSFVMHQVPRSIGISHVDSG